MVIDQNRPKHAMNGIFLLNCKSVVSLLVMVEFVRYFNLMFVFSFSAHKIRSSEENLTE